MQIILAKKKVKRKKEIVTTISFAIMQERIIFLVKKYKKTEQIVASI